MKKNLSIKLKAAFLLIVFSLNMIVGFACSVGIDMGFNSHHHDEETTTTNSYSHHHDETDNHHQKSTSGKDNCCNGKVIKIAQVDKSLPPSNTIVNSLFFASFISAWSNINVLDVFIAEPGLKYFVRSSPPTISDIRIAIQSFQI